MKIITISRQFGSGGRELGKRLADRLGFDYYDRELISAIAEKCSLTEDYAEYLVTNPVQPVITVRQSFHSPDVLGGDRLNALRRQTEIIKSIGALGRDAVIIGRNSDLLLEEYSPFNIFVCADRASKLRRCMERAQPGEELGEKQMLRRMAQIDKNRRRTREMISDRPWGDPETYALVVNTSGWEIRHLTEAVAEFAQRFFERQANT